MTKDERYRLFDRFWVDNTDTKKSLCLQLPNGSGLDWYMPHQEVHRLIEAAYDQGVEATPSAGKIVISREDAQMFLAAVELMGSKSHGLVNWKMKQIADRLSASLQTGEGTK